MTVFRNIKNKLILARFGDELVTSQRSGQASSRLLILMNNLGLDDCEIRNALFPRIPSSGQWLVQPVRFLDLLDQLDVLLSAPEIAYLAKGRARLLLDMSVEAMDFSGYAGSKLLSLHKTLEINGIEPSRVTLLNSNLASNKWGSKWSAAHGLANSVRMIGYSFYLFEYLSELKMSQWFLNIYPKYQKTRKQELTSGSKKLFICLNLRPRPHRLAIVLFLLRNGLLENSTVSFFGQDFGHRDTKSVAPEDEALQFIENLPVGTDLIEAYPALTRLLPITVDRAADVMRRDLWARKPGEIGFLFPESAADGSLVCNSYLEIVTETWFTDDSCVYLTEKTLRPIMRMQPFIVVGTPGTLRYLQSLGFETFSPLIDETYDEILDPGTRFAAICREISRLAAMKPAQLNEMQRALFPRMERNATLLLEKGAMMAEHEIRSKILPVLAS